MSPMRFLTRLGSFVQSRAVRPLNDIWSVEEFAAVVGREIARAYRHGREFSLVVFDGIPIRDTQDLGRMLCDRLRSTDEVGWVDRQHIGVILPDTSAEGARRVADDVCQTIARSISPPEYRVHTYPSQWLMEGGIPVRQHS
jgi:hypothetical protein